MRILKTVSVKFRTKEDIVETISSSSFKSKSHKRQSQILNLIEQRVRVALDGTLKFIFFLLSY